MEIVNLPQFIKYRKIPRFSRECIVTEKIDGTNGIICITPDLEIYAGSRTRWLTLEEDNFGFCKWVNENKEELLKLGPGYHAGEWWGQGIQRNYGLKEKRFSLFNTDRWGNLELRPNCCSIVPIITKGLFSSEIVNESLDFLQKNGSMAVPGFMNPEGIVILHIPGNNLFKKTFKDEAKNEKTEV